MAIPSVAPCRRARFPHSDTPGDTDDHRPVWTAVAVADDGSEVRSTATAVRTESDVPSSIANMKSNVLGIATDVVSEDRLVRLQAVVAVLVAEDEKTIGPRPDFGTANSVFRAAKYGSSATCDGNLSR